MHTINALSMEEQAAKAEQAYLKALNEEHEKRLMGLGIDRFLDQQRKGREKLNKITGQYTKVEEESNTAYGAMLVKRTAGLLTYYLQEWAAEYNDHRKRMPDVIKMLNSIDIPVAAYITVTTIVDSISTLKGMTAMAMHISKRIEDQMRFFIFEQANPEYMQSLEEDWKRRNIKSYSHKRAVLVHCEGSESNKSKITWIPWQTETCCKLGYALIDSLINATSDWTEDGKRVIGSGLVEKHVEVLFDHKQNGSKKQGMATKFELLATEGTLEMIKDCVAQNARMHPWHMPILCPPKDWTTSMTGGYHTKDMQRATQLVKSNTKFSRMFVEGMVPNRHEAPVLYESVNALQRVPYKINSKIFKQFEREVNREHGIKIPRGSQYIIPECPIGQLHKQDYTKGPEWKEARQEFLDNLTSQEKHSFGEWLEESRELYTREAKRKGEWVSVWQTLKTARDMINQDKFWFVWNLDSRSRAYTLSTALSFQGNTYGKSMLEYADPEPIGDGIRDILIHIAGVWGLDKDSINGRVAWAIENADNIYAAYQDPEATREWWGQADEPWEFLADCVQFGHAIKGYVQGMDVSGFESCGRIHFDGKCNSTQHFAMMLRDKVGAEQVNLLPLGDDDKPKDIYGVAAETAARCLESIVRQADNLNDLRYAKSMLEFGIDRKLMKKPTMTYTYGGTLRGTLQYLKEYLSDHPNAKMLTEWAYMDKDEDGNIIEKKAGGPRRYAKWLADKVYGAVEETMYSVKVGMEYLQKLGWAVSKNSDKAMVFYTPIGFPVLHFEDDVTKQKVRVRLRGDVVFPRVDSPSGRPNHWKMRSSLPPNFVHSMDATHMHMVVAEAAREGIEITPIHDSYGCRPRHAAYVKQLIRDKFVELYEVDRLQMLEDEQVIMNPDIADKIPAVKDMCEYGDFDIHQVRAAQYSFL